MDFNSIIGIIIALTAVFGGQMLEGGHPGSLIQLTSFAIVLGGTLGAVLLQSPLRQFVLGMKMSRWIFVPPLLDATGLLEHITIWSSISRKEGLLALDTRIEGIDDPFIRKGLQLVVDGTEPLMLKQVLEVEIETFDDLHRQGARVWEAAGGYAPTIGILGAGDGTYPGDGESVGPHSSGRWHCRGVRGDDLRCRIGQSGISPDCEQTEGTYIAAGIDA
jgi:chemotaxis protein MotA